jgi:hypothetical protein
LTEAYLYGVQRYINSGLVMVLWMK